MAPRWGRNRLLVAGAGGVLAAAVVTVLLWPLSYRPLYDESIDLTVEPTVAVADPAVALTFARTLDAPRRVLLVTSYGAGMVTGVDVGEALGRALADPVELLAEEGYDRLAALAADDQHSVSVPVDQLGIPLDLGSRHIATGLNFTAHTGEVAVDEGPFLFPKLVAPTAWNDPVPIGDALLDHETEIAWVPLTPITGSTPAEVGLILVNDYTDRAKLLELVDTDDVASGDGFTTAKSAPGYCPWGASSSCPVIPPRSSTTSCSDCMSTASSASVAARQTWCGTSTPSSSRPTNDGRCRGTTEATPCPFSATTRTRSPPGR